MTFGGRKCECNVISRLLWIPRGFCDLWMVHCHVYLGCAVISMVTMSTGIYPGFLRTGVLDYLMHWFLDYFTILDSRQVWFTLFCRVVLIVFFLTHLRPPLVSMNLFQFFLFITQFDVLLGWLHDGNSVVEARLRSVCCWQTWRGPPATLHLQRSQGCLKGWRRCKYCFKKFSICSKSFFSRSHLPLHIILTIYSWVHKLRVRQVLELLTREIASNNTVIDRFNFCRDVCS